MPLAGILLALIPCASSSRAATSEAERICVLDFNRIGEDGFGFKFAMKTLAGGRIGIASQALGIASGAYELAVAYSKERKAFGKPISEHQAIAFKLADMATEIEAARLLCLKAAWLKDQHLDYDKASSMAKLFASEEVLKVCQHALELHGGNGTMLDNSIVVWGSELGKGNSHSFEKVPFVVAGGAGGKLTGGRFLQFDDVLHNRLLVSVAQLMGAEMETFGTTDTGSGNLTGFV